MIVIGCAYDVAVGLTSRKCPDGISFNYNLNGAKLIVKAFPTAAKANSVA